MLRLYRQLLKTARRIEDATLKNDIHLEIKTEFAKNKGLESNVLIKTAIVSAQRSLTQLEDLSGGNKKFSTVETNPPPSSTKTTDNSWLNSSDKDDIRGRVGTGWPWK